MPEANEGRADLARWLERKPGNFYEATPRLARLVRAHAGEERLAAVERRLWDFGAAVATVVDPGVGVLESHRDLPRHRPYDGIGRRVDRVEFHPTYHEVGREVWRSGILALQAEPGSAVEQTALFYLLAHAGEGGHACPVACTAGLIRALQQHGPGPLAERFLPGLLEVDYHRAARASQFLTEVQGGSDVGANVVQAVPGDEEGWRITGEKWFCSVADADLFFVTARVPDQGPGTRGLGSFLVPRTRDDGSPNGFRIRRLKDKLGTRAMASAEIDFDGATAHPVGRVEDGFKIAAGVVLNTSRWLNAAGSAGLMRRACLEAVSYAAARRAFGRPIADHALVREQLAVMTVEEQAAVASTFELAALVDRIDLGVAGPDDVAFHRLLVNANKYVTSVAATDVVHRAIEVLGGNGTIEDFSCLPRLYRDAIVFESWEGTHNVLCEQVRRDIARLGILDPVLELLRARLARSSGVATTVMTALDALGPALREAADHPHGSLPFRRLLGRLTRAIQATCLLTGADHDPTPGTATAKEAVAELFVHRHLVPAYDPTRDGNYPGRIEAALAEG
jgi:alkylation response protein AidB-like acyl-CoA dehydrogenase